MCVGGGVGGVEWSVWRLILYIAVAYRTKGSMLIIYICLYQKEQCSKIDN